MVWVWLTEYMTKLFLLVSLLCQLIIAFIIINKNFLINVIIIWCYVTVYNLTAIVHVIDIDKHN